LESLLKPFLTRSRAGKLMAGDFTAENTEKREGAFRPLRVSSKSFDHGKYRKGPEKTRNKTFI